MNMQTIDEVKNHCRMVGEGIAAAVTAGEGLGECRYYSGASDKRSYDGRALDS